MKTVFFDVDTQLDFLYPAGALAVPGAADIVKNLRELTRFAAAHAHQIISTADAHSEDDAEFKQWKPHCVAGTTGQQKPADTLLSHRRILSAAMNQDLRGFEDSPQIVVEKQQLNCFTNANLRPLLKLLAAERYVVYGVVSEYCVRFAALGLLASGAEVELVSDAIKCLDPAAELAFVEQFRAQGGRLTATAMLAG